MRPRNLGPGSWCIRRMRNWRVLVWHHRRAHAWCRICSGWTLGASRGVGVALRWHLSDTKTSSGDLLPSCAAAAPALLLLHVCSEHEHVVEKM